MRNQYAAYEQEEKSLLGMIEVCESCKKLVFEFVREQKGSIKGIVIEDLLMSIFKLEMEQRENLLHLQLAMTGWSQTNNERT